MPFLEAPSGVRAALASIALLLAAGSATASQEAVEHRHAIVMHGEPALEPGFDHLPYVNPDAPRGGELRFGVIGTFDSLNPFILASMRTTARGLWDPQFGRLIYESLMSRSADEPFTLYGLIAQSVAMPEDRSWMEFAIDPRAAWADGKPITPEDVIFTFELLERKARPPFATRKQRIEKIEKTGDRRVKFTFNDQSDREFPLIVAGFTPILPRHAIDEDSFDASTLEPILGSGPYRVETVEPGTRIAFARRDDYWADDLPVNRGRFNAGRISIEYFRSVQAHFQAFKKGLFDVHRETDPADWLREYDFPAVADGRIVRDTYEKRRPAPMEAFVFNTRRPVFADRRVRQALAMAFDFEWANRNLFFDAYERTASFWQGSPLSALGIPADATEQALLADYPEAVAADVMAGRWRPPQTDGSGRDRAVLRAAFDLLAEAGYRRNGGRLIGRDGTPLAFEIMTRTQREERLAIAFQRSLDILGIEVTVRSVDDAQFQRRSQEFDFDMRLHTYSASLSPGIEQELRWASFSRDMTGSFNFAGAADPAIDAMIAALMRARSREDFESAVRALDRVLVSGHYVVPLFHLDEEWVARWSHVGRPDATPLYGPQFTTWWDKRAGDQQGNAQ